ncbi:hypothetical protein [Lysobacter tyrosinilyticus]
MDQATWEAWRKDEIQKHGNDPVAWARVSKNLVVSASVLASTDADSLRIIMRNLRNGGSDTDRPRTPDEEAIVQKGHQTHRVTLMLLGFAIECLLKAVFLSRGGQLYLNGTYASRSLKQKGLQKSHNLLQIANVLDCASLFSAEQLDLLDDISASNEMGRYPAHSRFDEYGLQCPAPDGTARFYGLWGPGRTSQVFFILRVLYTELGDEIPNAAFALLEPERVARLAYGWHVP